MSLGLKAKALGCNIILVESQRIYQLASTFVRLQEFYESPFYNIRDQYFELTEFMDTYEASKGEFSYFSDWVGFNIPGNVVEKFKSIFLDLNHRERSLFELIKPLIPINQDYYLIGSLGEDVNTIKHELAHALYYLSPEYKSSVTKLLAEIKPKLLTNFHTWFESVGYDPAVYTDEIQAYLSTASTEELDDINKQLKSIRHLFVENLNSWLDEFNLG